ncbi:MAG TPA: M20/M25/M40 family metallo-hydrolase [Pyrinomonadaceae bacterium]|nr:M20/M25/M40 family metallo-hydrolase [Pyrinomonadaceae bacterium]
MLRRKLFGVLLIYAFVLPGASFAQTAVGVETASPQAAVYNAPKEVIDKIRDEGMNRSQLMQTLSYLTDVIGARLTGSPSLLRANEWTRDTMTKWGMKNGHLEAWGPFGRGWVLKSFSAEVSDPYTIPLIAYPKAWAPSTNGTLKADVVYIDAKDDAALEKYKGQLKGKIVMISDIRPLEADFTGIGRRVTDEKLAEMAAAADPATITRTRNGQPTPEQLARRQAQIMSAKKLWLAYSEGAAMIIDNSRGGADGTVFVQQAAVAQEVPANGQPTPGARRMSAWQKEDESKVLPQVTLATEHYNRLVRMLQQGEKLKMSVKVDAQYIDGDGMVNNTIAEIPGTDPKLKDEVVMLGGHMDSWHAGTGATDNGAGVAVAMEAARIIQALGLKPRRTIRVALWTGEEQGLIGSRAYVKQHFGEMKNAQNNFGPPDPNAPKPELVKGADYEKLSAYYNLDNGTGKIRGVYMQGNSAVRPYFQSWLAPFGDLDAKTLTMSNTGGTDHLSFDAIGLPGFQFIQDEIEYDTLTHHSNQDVFDRIQAKDLEQAATIMAAFVYQTAMMDEKMPRKPMK